MKEFVNLKDLPKADGFDEKYLIVATYGNYTLIYRFTSIQPWVVAYLYNPQTKSWAQGYYFEWLSHALIFALRRSDIDWSIIEPAIDICDQMERSDIADLLSEMYTMKEEAV